MANKKISELNVAGALTGLELVEVVQGGQNVKSTTQDIADLASPSGAVSSVNGQTGAVSLVASNIPVTPVGGIIATDVQAALAELDGEISAIPSASNVRRRLGEIFNKTLVAADSSLYTDTSPNTTFTFTSGGVTATGGNNDALNWLEYTSYNTCTHYWKRKIRFVPTSDGNGIGVGINSANGKQLGRIILTGANKGKVLIDTYRSGTLTNRVTSSAALTYTNTTDTIELTLEKSMTTYRITAQVVGTPASVVSVEWVDTITYPTVGSVWAVGKSSIYHFGGDQTITKDIFIIDELVQNEIVIVSDSIGAGSFAGTLDAMWSQLLAKWVNKGVGLLAGGGNLTADYTAMASEFLSLKPKIAIWTLGVNDAINSVSLATTQANVLSFIQNCLSNNIQPVLVEIMQAGSGNAANINAINSWMSGLGYVKYISTSTMYSGSSLLAAYDAGDGIHLNAAGNRNYASIIAAAIRNMVNLSQAFAPTFTASGWTETQANNSSFAYRFENTTSGTSAAMSVRVGAGTATMYLTTYSQGYTALTSYASKSVIQNDGSSGGIMLIASDAAGTLQFLTGGSVVASNTRMTISTTAITNAIPMSTTISQNSTMTGLTSSNANTGTAGASRVLASTDTGSAYLLATSSTYSSTDFAAAGGYLVAGGTVVGIVCANASGSIIFRIGASGSMATVGLITTAGLHRFGDGTTPTAIADFAASTTSRASIRIRNGVAPTSPNDGDLWYDGTDLKFRQSGTTKTVTLV